MRTVRSAARARNRPRAALAWFLLVALVLLAVLATRAHARPHDDELVDEEWAEIGERRGRVHVPVAVSAIDRLVAVAPSVTAVVAAAYRGAGLADDPAPGWRRRARLSALVPRVSLRTGQHQAWRDVLEPTVSHSLAFDVRATWDLDRLLFDGSEMRIATFDSARRRERRRLAAQVTRAYFDWIAAQAAAEHDARAALDAAEKTAQLDALTDGWFSQALAKAAERR